MSTDTPTDPQALRAEIARTRADLGATVEALASKMDVKTRAQDTVADVTDQAKAKVRELRTHVGYAADSLAGQVRRGIETVRGSVGDADLPATVRRPLPVTVIAAAAVAVGIMIWLIRRRRY